MKIEVKQEHIDKGYRRSKCWCPVALALRDAGLEQPSVNPLRIIYSRGLHTVGCEVPESAKQFILAFDVGECVKPFSFALEEIDV